VGLARRPVRGGGEAGVAAATAGAPHREHALARRREIADRLAGVAIGDDGAQRHPDDQVVAAGAVTIAALAVGSALGVIVALVPEVEQRGERGIGFEEHGAAIASVAAVGAAAGDELLATEAHAPGAAVAALHEDVDLVDEHRY